MKLKFDLIKNLRNKILALICMKLREIAMFSFLTFIVSSLMILLLPMDTRIWFWLSAIQFCWFSWLRFFLIFRSFTSLSEAWCQRSSRLIGREHLFFSFFYKCYWIEFVIGPRSKCLSCFFVFITGVLLPMKITFYVILWSVYFVAASPAMV